MYAIRVRTVFGSSEPPGLLFRSDFSSVSVGGRYETCHRGVFVLATLLFIPGRYYQSGVQIPSSLSDNIHNLLIQALLGP